MASFSVVAEDLAGLSRALCPYYIADLSAVKPLLDMT